MSKPERASALAKLLFGKENRWGELPYDLSGESCECAQAILQLLVFPVRHTLNDAWDCKRRRVERGKL